MFDPANYPFPVFLGSLFTFWLAALVGSWIEKKTERLSDEHREDFKFVLGSTLTLLGLIIGFTFSMAVGRYDQRKNYEEEEANAIGTEYVRAGLLPAADATKVRTLLVGYLDQRVLFYTTRDERGLEQIHAKTAKLQGE